MATARVLSNPNLRRLQTICPTHGETKPAGERNCWKCIELECYPASRYWRSPHYGPPRDLARISVWKDKKRRWVSVNVFK